MADIFISYAREDRETIEKLAAQIEAAGLSCWWDRHLVAGARYLDSTEAELNAARGVLVVWTKHSIGSHWVADEAGVGRDSGRLVPISLDGSIPPLGFRQFQVIDFSPWRSGDDQPVRDLLVALSGLTPQVDVRLATPPKSNEPVLAVLAFDNLSGDPELAFFSDGISDEILQTVSRGLKTIGRASSFQFRGPDKAVRKVAAELGASHVLDGSVRRGGGLVRISAQLVEAESQVAVWQGQYDRPARDLFAVQDEVAIAVAAALNCRLSPPPHTGEIDPETYELYLRVRHMSLNMHQPGQIDLIDQVTRQAPDFGPGWIEAARSRIGTRILLPAKSAESGRLYQEARAAADRATQLMPPDDASLTAFLVDMQPWCGGWTDCENRLRRALASNAHHITLSLTLGTLFLHSGRFTEAMTLFRELHDREPRNARLAAQFAFALNGLGRPSEALTVLEATCRRWPDAPMAWRFLVIFAAEHGRWDIVDEWTAPPRVAALQDQAVRSGLAIVDTFRNPTEEKQADLLKPLTDALLPGAAGMRLPTVALAGRFCDLDAVYDLVDRASFEHLIDPLKGFGDSNSALLFFAYGRRLRGDRRFVKLCARLGLTRHWIETERWPDCAPTTPYDFQAEARRLADTPLG